MDLNLAVLKDDDKTAAPMDYPMGFGLNRMRRGGQSPVVRGLMSLPRPVAPANGGETVAGRVTLAIEHRGDEKETKILYVFEISLSTGEKLVSPPVRGAGRRTEWTPSFALPAGEKLTWKAWPVQGEWRGPSAGASFSTKAAK